MSATVARVSPSWLAVREPADAAARATELVPHVERALPPSGTRVIHDLGCGTGSMARWLAPLLTGPQHWVLHDLDENLLALAAADPPVSAADGTSVTIEPRRSDISLLQRGDLDGAMLITASALLDMLSADELSRLVGECAGSRCPILLSLSVIGRVEIRPADPLDRRLAAAFDAHQRRVTDRGQLLGPDAVAVAAEAFGRLGFGVLTRPTPWRLGPNQSRLIAEWLTGWVGAACEQEPELIADVEPYLRHRLAQASAGRLAVTVGHADLLVRR